MTTDSQKEPGEGIRGMLEYGESINDSVFQYTATAKDLQMEVLDVAEASGFSIEQLLMIANGSHRGADAYVGMARDVVVMQAISTITGYPIEVLRAVAWFEVIGPHGDEFRVEPVPGEMLCSKNRIDVFFDEDLITIGTHAILTDALEMGLSNLNSFKKGDLIANASSKPTTSKTATQRLSGLRGRVRPRLPADVKIAKVIRVDPYSACVKWRDLDDRSRTGWVRMDGVKLVYSTRADEEDDDDDDDDYSWFFGGCG